MKRRVRIMVLIICIMVLTVGCNMDEDLIEIVMSNVAHGPRVPLIIGDSIYNLASEYVEATYGDIELDREQAYMNSVSGGGWYAYLYEEGDKGLGFEVYNDGEETTDNMNRELRNKRKELIEYMDELMPENKQYNEYVKFNPYGTARSIVNEGREIKNILKYVVMSEGIDLEIQRKKDIKIIKKFVELSEGLGEKVDGISVRYIESKNTDLRYYKGVNKDKYELSKTRLDRYNYMSNLYTGKNDCSNMEGIKSLVVVNYGVDDLGNILYLDENNEIKGGE